ncbi:stage V sporulation protein AE [Clostridium acetobutylicum]|uniref:Stage V sporulation AE, SpoVAE n=1 Tax=Clostridium acetobutylicum (strain ATCC 824 / DSM 792 / JCM 1419 / IAM 19013 / LMG 5710 / NBRC 13948 / NRRL B-527 / VKM B-1787 / 2291 / W) TaxID=272562 RepID=Q97GR4_CLOAB
MKYRVIIITDGDKIAKKAAEKAAGNINGRCISISSGNPSKITGDEVLRLIKCAKKDPVIVMVDDKGDIGRGKGEEIVQYIVKSQEIKVIGMIAVASNTLGSGIKVDYSIDKCGNKIECAVDKYGNARHNKVIIGDTVNTINPNQIPVIIGIGDPGKMDGCDDFNKGCPILTNAIKLLINVYNERSVYKN